MSRHTTTPARAAPRRRARVHRRLDQRQPRRAQGRVVRRDVCAHAAVGAGRWQRRRHPLEPSARRGARRAAPVRRAVARGTAGREAVRARRTRRTRRRRRAVAARLARRLVRAPGAAGGRRDRCERLAGRACRPDRRRRWIATRGGGHAHRNEAGARRRHAPSGAPAAGAAPARCPRRAALRGPAGRNELHCECARKHAGTDACTDGHARPTAPGLAVAHGALPFAERPASAGAVVPARQCRRRRRRPCSRHLGADRQPGGHRTARRAAERTLVQRTRRAPAAMAATARAGRGRSAAGAVRRAVPAHDTAVRRQPAVDLSLRELPEPVHAVHVHRRNPRRGPCIAAVVPTRARAAGVAAVPARLQPHARQPGDRRACVRQRSDRSQVAPRATGHRGGGTGALDAQVRRRAAAAHPVHQLAAPQPETRSTCAVATTCWKLSRGCGSNGPTPS